jgi:c-di-GMP-binding flagellar brake protein YcgR
MNSGQNQAGRREKRRHPRIQTSNVLEYVLLDENLQPLDQGIGRTLDLSRSGALLETQKPLQGAYIILITVDLEGKKQQVRGRVANTRKPDRSGFYLTGVEFIGEEDEQRNAIVNFVKAYHRRKYARRKPDGKNKPSS